MKRSKRYTLGNFIFDAIMTCITAGLWLIWVVIRELQNFNRI
jgi:hypothetical protein